MRLNDEKVKKWLLQKHKNICDTVKNEKIFMQECCFRMSSVEAEQEKFELDEGELKKAGVDMLEAYQRLC